MNPLAPNPGPNIIGSAHVAASILGIAAAWIVTLIVFELSQGVLRPVLLQPVLQTTVLGLREAATGGAQATALQRPQVSAGLSQLPHGLRAANGRKCGLRPPGV